MKNLHQPSKLLDKKEIEKLEKSFEKAWCKETTYTDVQNKWSKENKALGQCAITALIIYDLYGGKIALDKESHHLWNILPDGSEQDFSRSQFKEATAFHITKYQTKEEILFSEHGQRTQTPKRYELLKQRFQEEFKKLEN